jgi:uncharacterized protein
MVRVTESLAAARPISLSERVLAPDLARGVMLLFIALANSHYFLQSGPALGGFPRDPDGLDAVLTGVLAALVDGRAYPMFAALFGYGLVQIHRRRQAAGWTWKPIRKLLRRRSVWMILIGYLHGVLLYVGDIIAAYGVLAFLLVPLLRRKDRTLLILAGLLFVFFAVPWDGSSGSLTLEATDAPDPAMLPQTPWATVTERAPVTPVLIPLLALGLVVPFLLGIVAARRRILDQPERHLRLLRWSASVGIGAAVAGGLPVGLMLAGALDQPDAGTTVWYGAVHDATGYLGGLGYAAAIALLAARIGSRRGRFTQAVVAVGQRSMTCYLCQSVVWTVVFAPYLLDLNGSLTVTTTAMLATGTWLLTVVVAELMRRHDKRGPFEVLLRRLTYRTAQRPAMRTTPRRRS